MLPTVGIVKLTLNTGNDPFCSFRHRLKERQILYPDIFLLTLE